VELILEVEVSRIDVCLAALIRPLKLSLRLVPLVKLPLELVILGSLLPLPMEEVLQEVSLVGGAGRLVAAFALCHVVMEVAFIEEAVGREVGALAVGLPMLEVPREVGPVRLVHPSPPVRVFPFLGSNIDTSSSWPWYTSFPKRRTFASPLRCSAKNSKGMGGLTLLLYSFSDGGG
jgi:hypothetical protein